MLYAIMSDVHSNPAALGTALADARELGCARFVLLGDITGYGYDVRGAMAAARSSFDLVLLGNHDSACLGRETSPCDLANPNYDIDRAQRGQLTKSDLRWLGARELVRSMDGMALAHGDFVRPGAWGYIVEERDALMSFNAREESLMFCGHTHHAAVWRSSGPRSAECVSERLLGGPPAERESVTFRRGKGERHIVNVGSVGYPRNDLCSTYAICDPESDEFTIRRIPFDYRTYVSEMLRGNVGLPPWLCRMMLLASRFRPG
ncbi:MAG: metallophosphoesterase family protein [Kiritimatiellae bacterium]|nr:metallophosphoesterase family protein [Kiritimatiellia bacterium]